MRASLSATDRHRLLSAQTPRIAFCAEKNRLLGEFLKATHELSTLLGEQTRAVIEGDADFTRFDVLLHFAQEKKEWAKYAWIAHVEQHGCHEGEPDRWHSHERNEQGLRTAG